MSMNASREEVSLRARAVRRLHELVGRARSQVAEQMAATAGLLGHRSYIPLDYVPAAANTPRYGYGLPPNPWLEELIRARDDQYRHTLTMLATFADDLARIEVRASNSLDPSWVNGFLPGLDSAAIYCFLRHLSPKLYLEIGSGNSTLFAARARRDGELATSIVSIDPFPRVADRVSDESIRDPLELVDPGLFRRVTPGDVVFFDGSHRVFMNSDATTFFLDVLPQLPNDVLVGIHDIYLPDDYPSNIASRYYSEQYLLAAYLLGARGNVEIVLPAMYVSRSQEFAEELDQLWLRPAFQGVERHGGAFWFRT
jgi:hypothetical protein